MNKHDSRSANLGRRRWRRRRVVCLALSGLCAWLALRALSRVGRVPLPSTMEGLSRVVQVSFPNGCSIESIEGQIHRWGMGGEIYAVVVLPPGGLASLDRDLRRSYVIDTGPSTDVLRDLRDWHRASLPALRCLARLRTASTLSVTRAASQYPHPPPRPVFGLRDYTTDVVFGTDATGTDVVVVLHVVSPLG